MCASGWARGARAYLRVYNVRLSLQRRISAFTALPERQRTRWSIHKRGRGEDQSTCIRRFSVNGSNEETVSSKQVLKSTFDPLTLGGASLALTAVCLRAVFPSASDRGPY